MRWNCLRNETKPNKQIENVRIFSYERVVWIATGAVEVELNSKAEPVSKIQRTEGRDEIRSIVETT
jgi:hypothetical protein